MNVAVRGLMVLVRRKKGSDHGPSCARNDF
jgi:hypothetical protein